jgi:hypothetical protein
MKPLPMLSSDQKLAEIKRLYYETSRQTITQDFAKAIDLVKSLTSEQDRERVAVYMDGLSQMRSDWARAGGWKGKKSKNVGFRNAGADKSRRR